MSTRTFGLKPFPAGWTPSGVLVRGSVERSEDVFSFHIELAGNLSSLRIPAPAAHAKRRDSLWENTCFEFFLAPTGISHYWEFNLSPSSDWNVYRFDAYRRGMRPEDSFSDLPFKVCGGPGSLAVSVQVERGTIIPGNGGLDIGVSTVLKGRGGEISYWALAHPGPRPDFHARESFIIHLPD